MYRYTKVNGKVDWHSEHRFCVHSTKQGNYLDEKGSEKPMSKLTKDQVKFFYSQFNEYVMKESEIFDVGQARSLAQEVSKCSRSRIQPSERCSPAGRIKNSERRR